jgi:iron complex outermembrane receptor protein
VSVIEKRQSFLRILLPILIAAFLLPFAILALAEESTSPSRAQADVATPRPAASPARRGRDSTDQSPGRASQTQSKEKESQAQLGRKGGIEEIVVTAQKRSELAQDVPISLTALGGQKLAFRGIEDLRDLQFEVPGLFYGTDTGANQIVAIRGISETVPEADFEAPVATYVDGVYQTRNFRSPNLGLDLKRIEVLRGPQGTLSGRNATGGAINIILEEPTEEPSGKARVGVGNYGQATLQGIASGPLIKGGLLSGRMAAAFDHYGGDVENIFPGRVTPKYINGYYDGTGRLALRFRPLESLTADLSILANKKTGGGVPAPTVLTKIGTPAQEAQGTIFPPTDPNSFVGPRHPHKVKLNRPQNGDLENYQIAFTVVWDFGWASLKSITAYQNHSVFMKYDVDGSSRDVVWVSHRNDSSKAISQELNFLGTTRWFTWLAGTHFMSEDFRSIIDPIFLPSHGAGVGLVSGIRGHEPLETYSFFGDATVPLPKGFKLFGGMRYTHDTKTMNQTERLRAGGGLLGLPIGPFVPPVTEPGNQFATTCNDLKLKDSFSNWSPRYGLQWDATEDVNIYAKESFGYNAGGHYFAVCNNPYKAETLDTIEGGIKTRWFSGRLVANVSLFRNKFRNFQILKAIGLSSFVVNAPSAETTGSEFELIGLPTEALTLNAGISLLHSKYVKFVDTDDTNPNAGLQDLAGKQLSNAPNYTVNLGAEYAWPIPGQWFGSSTFNTLRLRGQWFHTDYILFRPFGDSEDKQKNYSIFSLFAAVTSRDEKFELRAFAKNVTDTQYFGFKFAFPWGYRIGVGGPPRIVGTELTFKF